MSPYHLTLLVVAVVLLAIGGCIGSEFVVGAASAYASIVFGNLTSGVTFAPERLVRKDSE